MHNNYNNNKYKYKVNYEICWWNNCNHHAT